MVYSFLTQHQYVCISVLLRRNNLFYRILNNTTGWLLLKKVSSLYFERKNILLFHILTAVEFLYTHTHTHIHTPTQTHMGILFYK
jgi:hypothetical protein